MMKLLAGLPVMLGLAAVAHADAKIDEVKKAVEHTERALSGEITKAEAAGFACIKAIDAAISGGATAKTEVPVPEALRDLPGARQEASPSNHGQRFAPLGSVRDYCTTATTYGLKLNAQYAVETADKWVASLKKQEDQQQLTSAGAGTDKAKECFVAVDAAVAKLPPETELEIYLDLRRRTKTKVVLKDARSHCQTLADLGAKIIADAKAAREAALAPYRAALSGDKLQIFEEVFGLEAYGVGIGGVAFEEPDDYKKAAVWFSSSIEAGGCAGGPRWYLRRYQFKGMALKKTSDSNGCGSSTPTKAYR